MRSILIYFFVFACVSFATAQTTPPGLPTYFIQNYNKQDYNASCQNWGSAYGNDGILYVANNSGLLTFDGNNWHSYSMPEGNGIIHALSLHNDTLFCGSLNDVGYWYRDQNQMYYQSLIQESSEIKFKNETFDRLFSQKGDLWIKSQHFLLRYQRGKLITEDTLKSRTSILFTNGQPAHQTKSGVTAISGNRTADTEQLVLPENTLFLFPSDSKKYIAGTGENGLFIVSPESCKSWEIDINEDLKKNIISAYAQIGSYYCIGTRYNGLYLIDHSGHLIYHFSTDNKLQGNTIHHIAVQGHDKLWVSLDNGISSIDLRSPISLLAQRTHQGKLLDAAILDQQLWIETNLGLFKYSQNRIDKANDSDFLRWKESRKQNQVDIPMIVADSLEPIRKRIRENGDITWVLKENNQVARIRLSKEADAESVKIYDGRNGISAKKISDIAIIDDIPILATGSGLFRYDKASDRFYCDTLLNQIEDLREASLFFPAKDNFYWVSKANEAFLYSIKDRQSLLIARINFSNYNLNLVNREKRIIPLSDSLHMVSTMEGIVILNTHWLIRQNVQMDQSFSIRNISYSDNRQEYPISSADKRWELPHSFKQIEIEVGTSFYTATHPISYQLLPFSQEWSPWQKDGKITFWQLPPGKYELNIRKYTVRGPFTTITIPLVVKTAWYYSTVALICWIALIGIVIYIGIKYRFEKKEAVILKAKESELLIEQHEKQRLKNEILETELKNKNNELLLQTTALIKRNETMQGLLDELETQKEKLGERYPNKMYQRLHDLIEKSLNNPEDWILFESYFNTTHQNFTEKLRSRYDGLTANDLQMCCLLRMNLSSKEIASLQNISIRAVELRRYRLRKRLQLDNEENLVDFLLSL